MSLPSPRWGSTGSGYNKYGLMGALRAAAQMISYEIALALSVMGVLMISGTLNLVGIVQHQVGWHWNVFFQPFAFMVQAPGAFVCLGLMLGMMNLVGKK